MTTMVCALSRPLIVASVLDGARPPDWVEQHQARCLRCQATEARARTTGRSMRNLESVGAAVPPPGLTDSVVSGLDRPESDSQAPAALPWFAVAAGLAAVIVVVRRRRTS